jgi:macrophage erythroblast attacher
LQSSLEFGLRLQQLVEMIRSGTDPRTCLAHVKKQLTPHNATFPGEVRAACGMLAFPYDPASQTCYGYGRYFSPSRWESLANLFTETYNILLNLPAVPLLHVALASGLSALKTPACQAAAREDATTREATHSTTTISPSGQPTVCPVCSPELKDLAVHVPYAHHTKSIVEHDLRAMPNGRVYGKEKLEQHARKFGLPADQVKDLQTGEVFDMDKLRRVYIT